MPKMLDDIHVLWRPYTGWTQMGCGWKPGLIRPFHGSMLVWIDRYFEYHVLSRP